jgi:probable phosphomutase (TIGR03848 family)
MPVILLIRHGENSFVGKRLAGRLPGVHLNENGIKQAQAIAALLKEAPITAIYSSPLERAMETAQPLAEALNMPVQPCDGLLEVNFGQWQGKTIKQLGRLKLWKTVQEKPSEMRFPEGESFAEARERVVLAIEEIKANAGEKDIIACFSHSDTIRLAVSHYLAMPLDAFQRVSIDTASVSALFLGKDMPRVLNVNQVLAFGFKKEEEKKGRKRRGQKTEDREQKAEIGEQ